MNIVFLDAYTSNHNDISWEGLKKLGNFIHYDRTPEPLVAERLKNADN